MFLLKYGLEVASAAEQRGTELLPHQNRSLGQRQARDHEDGNAECEQRLHAWTTSFRFSMLSAGGQPNGGSQRDSRAPREIQSEGRAQQETTTEGLRPDHPQKLYHAQLQREYHCLPADQREVGSLLYALMKLCLAMDQNVKRTVIRRKGNAYIGRITDRE